MFHVGADDGTVMVVMELESGQSMKQALTKMAPFVDTSTASTTTALPTLFSQVSPDRDVGNGTMLWRWESPPSADNATLTGTQYYLSNNYTRHPRTTHTTLARVASM